MNKWRDRWGWFQYAVVYVIFFLVCWGSLAALIANGAKYVSILSWNLFGLEELYRHHSGATRAIVGFASFMPAAAAALIFAATAWLIRSPKLRVVGIVVAVFLAIATLLWLPNPWENM